MHKYFYSRSQTDEVLKGMDSQVKVTKTFSNNMVKNGGGIPVVRRWLAIDFYLVVIYGE